jgi:hypothetical protein
MTLTQIGQLFGETNQMVGKWLASAGLRDDRGKPTRQAHDGGFCETAPSRNDGFFWSWRPEKVVPVLETLGHRMLSMPPVDLVEPPPLSGPFGVRTDANGFTEVTNADGTVAALVPGRPQAEKLVAVMNLAHKHGKLGHAAPAI